MVKVSFEVGAAGFQVVVAAQPSDGCWRSSRTGTLVTIPEAFFVSDMARRSMGIELEMPESVAG